MATRMVLVVALIAAGLAWGLAGSDDFGLAFHLGLIALAGGTASLALPGLGRLRLVCALLALSTLPATAAIRMWRIAGSFEPYAIWLTQKDLSNLGLPVAPDGTFDPRFPPKRVVNLTADGYILMRGELRRLGELRGVIAAGGEAPIMLRADYTTPWLHFSWLLDAAREAGASEVRLTAAKYVRGRLWREDRSQIRGEMAAGDWPEVELLLPLRGAIGGTRLYLAVEAREARERWPRPEFEFPVKVRYELDGRVTTDLDQLGSWMRDGPPARLEAEFDVPLMFVATVLNELVRVGRPMPALVTPREPMARELDVEPLPWPGR